MKKIFGLFSLFALLIVLAGFASSAYLTPLMDAADRGDINAVKALLDKGEDVNEWNSGTALMQASHKGHTDVVKLLIDRGANLNVMSSFGYSALGMAAATGQADTVKILIDKGANIDEAIMGLEKIAAHFTKSPAIPEQVARCESGINLLKEIQKTLSNKAGWAYYSKGQYQEAINSFKQAISLNPSISDNFKGLSASYNKLKQYDEAITAAKRAIELKPNNADAYHNLGIAYGMKKQYSEAIKALQKAIEINPKMSVTYAWMGRFLMQKDAYTEAVEVYKKVIEIAPSILSSHGDLAMAYFKMGKFDETISVIDRGIKLWTSTGTGLEQVIFIEDGYPVVKTIFKDSRAQVFENGPAKIADIQTGDKIVKIDGQSTKGLDIAKVLQKMFGHEGTQVTLTIERNGIKEPLTKVITQETYILKDGAALLAIRSLAYRHKDSLEAALKGAEKAYSLDSGNDWARLSLGAAYLDRGQYDESIKLLSQIKDNPMARLLEATAHAKQGKAKEAATIYLSIPEEAISPKNIPLMNDRMVLLQTFKPIVKEHRDKARSFESKGQYQEALAELSEALKIADDTEAQAIQETTFSMLRRNPLLAEMPEDARKYALRSEVLLKEGNLEQAATELKMAIQIAPYAARLYYSSALINAELKRYPEAIHHMKIYLKAVPDAPDARAVKDEMIKWEFMMEKGK